MGLAPEIAQARQLTTAFLDLIRTRDRGALEPWLTSASAEDMAQFHAFAAGIRRDQAAVEAALELERNNGMVKGQITRLKLIKRQGYGRAGFDLLRQRVLAGPGIHQNCV